MRDILPDFVREVIRERYITGVSDAEATFRLNSEDEDSLTGALGQALATPKPIVVWDNEQVFVIQIQHHKVRGKGPGAPEKILGTDGIFELEVFDGDGHSIRKKGLPFQSKKNWKSSNKKVAAQASDMIQEFGTGLVIDYTAKRYSACDANAVVETGGLKSPLDQNGKLKSLGQLLGQEFLDCEIGKVDLVFDEDQGRPILTRRPLIPRHVIKTVVKEFTAAR